MALAIMIASLYLVEAFAAGQDRFCSGPKTPLSFDSFSHLPRRATPARESTEADRGLIGRGLLMALVLGIALCAQIIAVYWLG